MATSDTTKAAEESNGQNHFVNLPKEVLDNIASGLDKHEVLNLGQVLKITISDDPMDVFRKIQYFLNFYVVDQHMAWWMSPKAVEVAFRDVLN